MAKTVRELLDQRWEEIREEGRTGEVLASVDGISYDVIRRLCREVRHKYDPDQLRRLATAMEIEFDELRQAAGWGD